MPQAVSHVTPIYLPPSISQTVLESSIHRAVGTGRVLLLEPGKHYTQPGRLNTIEVGTIGLEIGSGSLIPPLPGPTPDVSKTVIQRPDFSIPATAPDDNFGLFFVPASPSDAELAGAVWKPGVDPDGTKFEFDVFIGGAILIRDLTLDANMGRQNLGSLDPHAAAHSTMLGFAPKWHPAGFAADGTTPRRAYVVFRNVTLQNLRTINGGFSDDILFTHFGALVYPVIQEVTARNIVSVQRVDTHGGTITFAAPPGTVNISGTDIFKLHVESDLDWKSAPRKDANFNTSIWGLDAMEAQFIIFSMAGKIMQLRAQGMTATAGCQIELLSGTISQGVLTVLPGEAARFFRLDGLTFDHVTWHFAADSAGAVTGLWLGTLLNDTSAATFLNNKFGLVPGTNVTSGQLINSVYSQSEPLNTITATFRNCEYEASFGSIPNTKIARVRERGTWRFAREDFRGRDPLKVIEKGPDKDVVLIIAPSKTVL